MKMKMNANDYAMAADRSGERRRLKPHTTVYISHSAILCCVDANAYKWNAYNEYTVAKNIIEYAWTMRGNGNNVPTLDISSKKKKKRKITTPRYLQWKRVPIEQITITTKTPKSGSIALGKRYMKMCDLYLFRFYAHFLIHVTTNFRIATCDWIHWHSFCSSISAASLFFCSSLCCSPKPFTSLFWKTCRKNFDWANLFHRTFCCCHAYSVSHMLHVCSWFYSFTQQSTAHDLYR